MLNSRCLLLCDTIIIIREDKSGLPSEVYLELNETQICNNVYNSPRMQKCDFIVF